MATRKTEDQFWILVNYGYGDGYEHEVTEFTHKEAKLRKAEYVIEGYFDVKIQKKRVKIEKFTAVFPFIPSMGSVSPTVVRDVYGETMKEQALWYLNSMRDHDGLDRLETLPRGVKFEPITN